ncbi:hypothetical protein EON77_18775, partial [bacterium]
MRGRARGHGGCTEDLRDASSDASRKEDSMRTYLLATVSFGLALSALHCNLPEDSESLAQATDAVSGTGVIRSAVNSQKCLDVAAWSRDNGASVVLWDCEGNPNQTFQSVGKQLRVYGNKCLDVPGGENRKGVTLQIWDCHEGNTNQMFERRGDHLVWTAGNKCLDVPGGNASNLVRPQLWDCETGNPNQRWSAPGGTVGGGSAPAPPPPTNPT